MRNRGALTAGVLLIVLGGILLLGQFVPASWPLIIIGVGGVFLAGALASRAGGLAIPGMILIGTGAVLFYQATTGDWRSWYALWPLVPGAMGAGMVIAGLRGAGGAEMRRVGFVWLGLGVLFSAALWLLRGQAWVDWPEIIWGLGVMFLLAGLLLRAGGLFIPGAILGIVGGMLAWQWTSGQWESWAYLWPAVPGAVGLGLVMLGLSLRRGGRVVMTVGLYILSVALILVVIFAQLFGGQALPLLQYWPVLVVLIGLIILADALIPRRAE